jgi:predicted metal-dependent HD superfamily phosphohydrolase
MLDRERFNRVWRRLGGKTDPQELFSALVKAYAEPHRAYHTIEHIEDCLKQFDAARYLAEQPDEVEMALWFHDAVYDTQASDNEERSAEWAFNALSAGGIPPAISRRISDLVLATRHRALPSGRDAQLLSDVDLSILGRSASAFDQYDRAIRIEYQWVPEEVYRGARAQVLAEFLQRQSIYQTEHFRRLYEEPARRNLTRALARFHHSHD